MASQATLGARSSAASRLPVGFALLFALALAGCGSLAGPAFRDGSALRISEVDDGGDPLRRASLRVVERGLTFDAAGQLAHAQSEYERAIRVDAGNGYAYLALARHYLERGDPYRALRYLDQCEVLLRADPGQGRLITDPEVRKRELRRVRPHLDGLRGLANEILGTEGETHTLLERARRMAPEIWGDGRLSARELL